MPKNSIGKITLEQAIGKRLKKARKELKLSQEELCNYVNEREGVSINQATYSKIETGKTQHVDLILLAYLALIYHKSILDLLPEKLWKTKYFNSFLNEYWNNNMRLK